MEVMMMDAIGRYWTNATCACCFARKKQGHRCEVCGSLREPPEVVHVPDPDVPPFFKVPARPEAATRELPTFETMAQVVDGRLR